MKEKIAMKKEILPFLLHFQKQVILIVIFRSQILHDLQMLATPWHASFFFFFLVVPVDKLVNTFIYVSLGLRLETITANTFCFSPVTRNRWEICTARLMLKTNYLSLWNMMMCPKWGSGYFGFSYLNKYELNKNLIPFVGSYQVKQACPLISL